MKKENLKRLRAGLLASALCFTLGGCQNAETNEKEHYNDVVIVFLEGKALIYSGDYNKFINEDYTGIGGTALKYDDDIRFSPGTDAVELQNIEDAVELAMAIVGEENIIYVDYKDSDMQLSYKKKVKQK